MELISKFSPKSAPFGPVIPEQIADVTVHRGFAYLNSWDDPNCERGGVYVVDIRNPKKPKDVTFLPASPGNYHGEGTQVMEVKTSAFRGTVLAVNNERCANVEDGGGFDLYDVSDPKNPRQLVKSFGDVGPEGTLTAADVAAHDSHNIRMWQWKGKAYIVIVDNLEFHDVDIFDISDPANPIAVAEFDMADRFPQIVDNSGLGNLILNHDDFVKIIDGRPVLQLSYWDAGYVNVDISDPANPVYIGDSSFDGPDPLTGLDPAEGNAHQAEFSSNNKFLVAADEDFSPYRAGAFSIDGVGDRPSAAVGGGAAVAELPDRTLNGPVVWGGYGCPDSTFQPPERSSVNLGILGINEEAILVLERGPVQDPFGEPDPAKLACFPGEKAANGIAKGWDAILLVNRHGGSADADAPFCGSGAFPAGAQIVTLCTTHGAFHEMFGTTPRFELPYLADDAPAIGTVGTHRVRATSVFDGWGYAQLYKNEAGKMTRVDSYAIPESLDPAFSSGFGDLSIHEWATDPKENLAYSSYYSGGLRVVSFGDKGFKEVGRFIDEGGNNFWGVELTKRNGPQMIAASDRDHGLYLFRYKGPKPD